MTTFRDRLRTAARWAAYASLGILVAGLIGSAAIRAVWPETNDTAVTTAYLVALSGVALLSVALIANRLAGPPATTPQARIEPVAVPPLELAPAPRRPLPYRPRAAITAGTQTRD